MDRIDQIRNRLHAALDNGNIEEILKVSKELDIEIARFYRTQFLGHPSSKIGTLKEINKAIRREMN